jgi:hypothetical protein
MHTIYLVRQSDPDPANALASDSVTAANFDGTTMTFTFSMPSGGVNDLMLTHTSAIIPPDTGGSSVAITSWPGSMTFDLSDPGPNLTLYFSYDTIMPTVAWRQWSGTDSSTTQMAFDTAVPVSMGGNTGRVTFTPTALTPGGIYSFRAELTVSVQNPNDPNDWLTYSYTVYSGYLVLTVIGAVSSGFFFEAVIEEEIYEPEINEPEIKEPEENDTDPIEQDEEDPPLPDEDEGLDYFPEDNYDFDYTEKDDSRLIEY